MDINKMICKEILPNQIYTEFEISFKIIKEKQKMRLID